MSILKIKDRYLSGNLVLHCSLIQLEQCGVAMSPKSYSGSGSITLNPRAGFSGSFVSSVPVHMFAQIIEDQQLVQGEIVPESHFYRLHATSVDGTTWINPKVAISLTPGAAGTLVTFNPDFLTMSRPATDMSRTAAEFVFLDTLPFPLNASTHITRKGPDDEQSSWTRDRGEHRTARMHMKYREWKEEPVHSQFTVIFSEPAPLGFDNRLLEALRFSTAVPASWVMLEYVQSGTVRLELSPYRPPQNHLVNEPVPAREAPLDFFRLLEAYYVHCCGHAEGEDFSQLSLAVGPLFALKGLDIKEISLVISVAIEAMLKEGFEDLDNTDPELVAEVKTVERAIDSLTTVREISRLRMKGSLGGLKSTRPQDKLGKLLELGLVTESELNHWKKLRNTSAHGAFRLDPQRWQHHLHRIFAVTTLAYKLAFLRIGYFGPYTDCGSPAWPTAWFPAKVDAHRLAQATEELAQLSGIEIEDKLHAWQAVESALRITFQEGDAGASRVPAGLVLFTAMRKAGALRLAELNARTRSG